MRTPRTETRRFLGFDGIRFVVRSQTRPSMGLGISSVSSAGWGRSDACVMTRHRPGAAETKPHPDSGLRGDAIPLGAAFMVQAPTYVGAQSIRPALSQQSAPTER
jgi:hypothetical protein